MATLIKEGQDFKAMLERNGFLVWNTGGNVLCYGKTLEDGGYFLITDEQEDIDFEEFEIETDPLAICCKYNKDGEPVFEGTLHILFLEDSDFLDLEYTCLSHTSKS
jgi:hypothetical protein